MNLPDLNTILSTFQEGKRENILNFSFALMEWMQILPNSEKRPQLLSPGTQKLRGFLATAPQTVQAQLYRLSADKQNIRVRFAVLKKIKKEYISQLVDNDPGLSSYQASMKGIKNIPGRPAYISSEPYFIHFVTTPEYDKLILIFNQGEQKRIVRFRNRLSHTQYNKIILTWQGIGAKAKPEIADVLWKSLDIREVNKEFYKQIKERFDALTEDLKLQHSTATDNQIKQFTVGMIGRYIFCWFLKEKGIIPASLIGKDTLAATDNYYQTVLLKLFFETLNIKVQDRTFFPNATGDSQAFREMFEKIPYLNGGLFEGTPEDTLFGDSNLDTWLLPFVDVLESYDFTVDESSSQYQQVAVDPEMLGRIFENLLASQNEETEKLANQRKAFGAFYTPREIVEYMVNEGIKAYLQTQWEQHLSTEKSKQISTPELQGYGIGNKTPQPSVPEPTRAELTTEEKSKIEKTLDPLFAPNPDPKELKKEEKNLLLGFLEQIKILDPACGSGAFPMGVLHKLVELHEALGTVKSSYELKKDILSHNIYGVDIMPMAVEIARLRAWLSLVLDEDYNPNDPKHNFGLKPLPNLDFKFVCANSLISLELDKVLKNDSLGLYNNFYSMLKDLVELRTQFFSPTLARSQKEDLKKDYVKKRGEIISLSEESGTLGLKEIASKLKEWNPFDDSKPSPFFSPVWMFGIYDGFDVVIGNPPYVQIQKMEESQKAEFEKQKYKTFTRTGDLYQLFYEQGIDILKRRGTLAFITSNKWMRTNYGIGTRSFFSKQTAPIAIIDFGMAQNFESATTYTNIFIGKKNGPLSKLPICRIGDDFHDPAQLDEYVKQNSVMIDNPGENSWIAFSKSHYELITKIEFQGKPLNQWDIKIFRGILTGCNDAFIIDRKTKDAIIAEDPKSAEIIRPILRGEDIKAYVPAFADWFLIATFPALSLNIDNYKGVKRHLGNFRIQIEPKPKNFKGDNWNGRKSGSYEWFETQDSIAYYEDFAKPKIIYPNMTKFLPFVYDESGILTNQKCFIITGTHLKFLTGIFNSKLWKFAFKSRFPELLGDTFELSKVFFDKIPIKIPGKTVESQIESLVDEILKKKKENQNTNSQENEIDLLVYKLYDLTYNEVKIIDRDFGMSEAEYNKVSL